MFLEPARAKADDVIDVLVVYTPYLVSVVPQPGLDTWIKEAFPMSNQVFVNNELPVQLRLVGTYMTSYTELGGTQDTTDLLRLKLDSDGYMDDVHAERDRLGADVVILLTTASSPCGRAYQMLLYDNDFSEWGFGYVRTDCYQTPYVLLHEIGHILGLSHNVEDTPIAEYDNGHGYRAPDNSYFTVMVQNNPTPTLGYFSSKDRLTPDGKPLGNAAKADSETVLRTTAPKVAAFRESVLPVGC